MPCSQASSFAYGEQEHQLQLQLLLPPQHQVTGCSRHMKQGILSWLGLLAPTAGMLSFIWQEARACSCSQLPQSAPVFMQTCMPSHRWHSCKACFNASWMPWHVQLSCPSEVKLTVIAWPLLACFRQNRLIARCHA